MHLSCNNGILSGALTICYALLSGRSYSDLATCCGNDADMVMQSYDRSYSRLCVVDQLSKLNFKSSRLPQG